MESVPLPLTLRFASHVTLELQRGFGWGSRPIMSSKRLVTGLENDYNKRCVPTLRESCLDFFRDVGFDFSRCAVGQHVLLVNRTPECQALTDFIFTFLWVVTRNIGLYRGENLQSDISQDISNMVSSRSPMIT